MAWNIPLYQLGASVTTVSHSVFFSLPFTLEMLVRKTESLDAMQALSTRHWCAINTILTTDIKHRTIQTALKKS